jgi:HK97 family phage major capsid protein/HK97 family phage prohead protease
MGCHATEDDAKAQQAALYAQEGQRMTTDAPESPLDGLPEWARPLLPDWVGNLRGRAVALDDIYVDRAKGGDGRTVTAYAAVFDSPAEVRDQDGHYLEQIHRAAFDRSLQARAGKINVFYNHGKNLYGGASDRGSVPIGTPVEIATDARGLRTVTRYNKTPLAEEILEAIKAGSMRGMSFTGAFLRSDPAGPYYARADGALTLVTRQEIALVEYGPTPIPTYDAAEVVGVRSGELEEGQQRASDRPWDAGANVARLSNDAGAATYRRMFAILRPGADPDLKGSYALPHHEVSADGRVGEANLAGVRNALSRLPQTQGLSEDARASAERHLRGHLPASSPASQGPTQGRSDTSDISDISDTNGDPPAPSTGDAAGTTQAVSPARRTETQAQPDRAPRTHAPKAGDTPTTTPRRTTVADQDVQETMTAQERAVRQGEIRQRMNEIANTYSGAELPADVQTEWDRIDRELDEHERAIQADTARRERLRQLAERQAATDGGERVDNSRAGYGSQAPSFVRTARPEDVYDLGAIRQRARSVDELPALYRENATRAVELSRFPGVRRAGTSREAAQQRVAELLDEVDEDGTLARRILVTGSPAYERAFGKWLISGGMTGLTAEEQRALSMGAADSAALAVPFTLDPTVILTSDGATNPLRAISRVETITGKIWEGVTSAGITVGRSGEATEVGDDAPTLAQPTVTPSRVDGFVPFSIESDQDWPRLRSEMTRLLQDAKDVEEATAFVTGNGTAPNPAGIASTLTTASNVNDGSVSFEAADIYAVENALPPRFQPRARWLGRKNSYNLVRALDTNGTLYARLTEGRPPELIGYPAHEASAMPTRTTFGNRYLILGDFQTGFLIVDKAGMDVELVPHLFHLSTNRPSGQRGLVAFWRNYSAILVGNAFRALTYAT